MYRKQRRILAGVLIVLGAMLMLFATESLGGMVLIALGISVEIIGIALEKKS